MNDVADDDREADGDISTIMINSNVSDSVINTISLIITSIKISKNQRHQEHHPHVKTVRIMRRNSLKARGTARKQLRTQEAQEAKSH